MAFITEVELDKVLCQQPIPSCLSPATSFMEGRWANITPDDSVLKPATTSESARFHRNVEFWLQNIGPERSNTKTKKTGLNVRRDEALVSY